MIVWLTGSTSAGKTWLGDFLQQYHGWIHIDGDRRLALEHDRAEIAKDLIKSFYEYWFEYKEAPLELWIPYYKDLCDRIADQRIQTPEVNIVLSFSTYPRVVRDYIREEVHKLTGENLIVIMLDMSITDYTKRQRAKLNEWLKATNKTIHEVWEEHENFRALGEYSDEKYNAYCQQAKEMKGLEPIQPDEPSSYTIDTGNDHVKVVPEITRILKLKPCENYDNDVIMKIRGDRIAGYDKERKELLKS